METSDETMSGYTLSGRGNFLGTTPDALTKAVTDAGYKIQWTDELSCMLERWFGNGRVAAAGSMSTAVSLDSDGVEHAFYKESYYMKANNPECNVIIQNGFHAEHDGFTTIPAFKEYVSVFVNPAVGHMNLSGNLFRAILRGEITNWRQLCGKDIPVEIFRLKPSGLVAKDYQAALDARLNLALRNFDLTTDECIRFNCASSYEELAELGRSNPGSLLFGLRQTPINGLQAVKINGVYFDLSMPNPSFPLNYNVSISLRNTSTAETTIRHFMKEIERRYAIDQSVWKV